MTQELNEDQLTSLFERQFGLRIARAESVQIVVQIPSSVDRGGAIGVLLKVELAAKGHRPAPVIGDQACASKHRGGGLVGGDRKSTRLNSSHVAISYAVFC